MNETLGNKMSGDDNKGIWRIINLLNLGLIFIISYFLTYMQAVGSIAADTALHIKATEQFMMGNIYLPHPLWHICTHYLSGLLEVNYNIGASIFTAFLVTLYAVIIYKIAQSLDEYKDNNAKWFLITMIALTIGPFFIMSLNSHIYMGPGSPSVWHNVTLTIVKPLALLSVFYTIKFFASSKFHYYILAVIVIMGSIFAKPSFIIVFLPSLVVYMLLKKYFDKQKLQFALIIIFLSVAILAYQFMNKYRGESDSTVIFDFLGVWSLYTPSVTVSILMALGLPLLITLFNYQSVKKNEYIKFTWLLVLFSTILFICFAEEGKHYGDGNFSWSWMINLSLIYIFTIIEYFKQYFEMPAIVRYPLLAMMLYQLYVGWYYLIGMFNGISFKASIDTFPFF